MISTVYGIECFKMRKRLATWVTYLCFLALSIFLFGSPYYAARGHGGVYWGLPAALPEILTNGAPIASIFGVVLTVLMVSSEFDWKTSRQNIIDGLSKRQWFVGKLSLIPTITAALYLTQLALGGALALIDTSPAHSRMYDPTRTYVLAGCGVLLGMWCYSSIGLLISLWARSTGPALALALIYQVFDNIAARTLRGFRLDAIADWLPFQVHSALLDYGQYLPHGGSSLDSHWNTWHLFAAGAGWTAALILASYATYGQRDL